MSNVKSGGSGSDDRVEKSAEEWRKELSDEQFHITREAGTERAFSGCFWNEKAEGTYLCVCCGAELFSSETKFDSGSGWPSFHQPMPNARITEHVDNSLGMTRTEITCARCDAHLGHVFPDGPPPSGLRYCLNSASLELKRGDGEGSGGA